MTRHHQGHRQAHGPGGRGPRRERNPADERDRALDALQALDPGAPREQWVRAAMAARAAGLAFEDWHRWSEGAGNYKGEADCRSVWRSISDDGGINAATLFGMARDAGWRDRRTDNRLTDRREPPARPVRTTVEARPEPPKVDQRPRFDIAAAWASCTPATVDHPYIERKVGLPFDLRVVPEDSALRIAGQSIAGWLAVPLIEPGSSEPASIQFIGPDRKLTAPGPMRGWFTVGGPITESSTVYVVEGIGQAWSAHQATRSPAVVAFGVGRFEAVAKGLRERFPGARLVLVPDVGQEGKAESVSKAIGCAWVELPTDLDRNGDINDLHQRDGMEAVAALLGTAREQSLKFRFVTVGELLRQPAPSWRVLRLIPTRGLVVLWGASGSGKTFAVLDLSCAIVRGLPWAGRRTRQGTVAYIAAEGQLRERIDAYIKANDLHEDDLLRLRVLDSAVNLLEPDADVEHLGESLRRIAIETGGIAAIVIDTLNRVMPGGDENSSEDMGMVVSAAKRLEAEFGCAVIFVHHSGKDESKGSRGHSSLKAATDAELSVKRDGDIRAVTAEKVRDGTDGEVLMSYRLRVIDLGAMTDHDPEADQGERRTSCVVDRVEVEPGAPAATRLSDTDHIALRVLREMTASSDDVTEETSIHPAGKRRVYLDAWRERFRAARGVDKSDAKDMEASKKAFQRALDRLLKARIVGVHEARAWMW